MLIHNVNSTNHAGGVSQPPPPWRTSGCMQVGFRRRRGALVVACRWGVVAAASNKWLHAGGVPQVDGWYSKCCVLETYSFPPSFLLSLPASLFIFLSFSPSHIYFDNLIPI